MTAPNMYPSPAYCEQAIRVEAGRPKFCTRSWGELPLSRTPSDTVVNF